MFNGLTILIRHFPTQDENEDRVSCEIDTPPITADALTELKVISEQLEDFAKRVGIKNIYCSDSFQAKQTATLISECTNLVVKPTELLRNIKRPQWEGLTNVEVKSKFANDFATWCNSPGELTFKNGESIGDVRKRVKVFMAQNDEPKIVVTHTTTFQSFILENFDLNNNLAWDFKPEMFCFTVLFNGTLWALNTRNLNYLTLHYK